MFVWMATGVIFLAPLAVSELAVGGAVSPLIGLMEQQVSNLLFCVSHLLATKKWVVGRHFFYSFIHEEPCPGCH